MSPWRIENGELDGCMAKNVMVMIGTNNEDSFGLDEIWLKRLGCN